MKLLLRHWVGGGLAVAILLAGCTGSALFAIPHTDASQIEPLVLLPVDAPNAHATLDTQDTLSIMTLNLAHGRSDGLHQALQSGKRATQNLDRVKELIDKHQVQLVALQEADSDSSWSGGFDHVGYLADDRSFDWSAHGSHVDFMGLDYGTALLSQLPMDEALSVRFSRETLALPKGFVVSSVAWPGADDRSVDVVSLHLDPMRAKVRHRQINELIGVLSERTGPYIVMGDFNSVWTRPDSAVRTLAEKMNLKAYAPEVHAPTFPDRNKRLDWILISDSLDFVSHEVDPATVSDHLAVVARIAWVS